MGNIILFSDKTSERTNTRSAEIDNTHDSAHSAQILIFTGAQYSKPIDTEIIDPTGRKVTFTT